MKSRTYRQGARAEAAAETTHRILDAALELFVERPFDQVTLASVAERAGVGLQTLIRRVGTKDGLVEAVSGYVGPQVAADLSEPRGSDPDVIAAALARQYGRWAQVIERTVTQQEHSPALAAFAESGRQAHRAWVASAFGTVLEGLSADDRRRLHARLVAVTGVELWLVLQRDEGLSIDETRDAVSSLINCCLRAAGRRHTP